MCSRSSKQASGGGVGFLVWMEVWMQKRCSKWHYGFTSKIVDKMAWEGIQFIGKRFEGWRAKMQGEEKA